MKIVEIREKTIPISSPIRNAYIDFSKMTLSLVAVITDVIRDGKPVVGYGFNSNGRYGQGKLMRERFIPRIMEANPSSLVDDRGNNLDPHKIWNTMFTNEKPGGHGERSVAIGTIDMAVWDAVAKIEGKPLFQLLARPLRRRQAQPQDLRLRSRRLLLPGARPRKAEGRDAQLHRPWLHGREEEDRRSLPRRRPAPHRLDHGSAAGRPEALRRRQRPLRPGNRDCLCQGPVAIRPVLVRGAGRPVGLRTASGPPQSSTRTRWPRGKTFSRCRMRAT